MKVSIVIPAHNEEANIAQTISSIEDKVKFEHEIVVVNDHSTDNTSGVIRDLSAKYAGRVRLLDNTDNSGFKNALFFGFKSANFQCLLPVMADLCDDPDTMNKMYDKMLDGYDIVCGSRYMKDGRKVGGPIAKTFFSRFFGLSLHFLIGIPTRDVSNSFKLYKKEILDKISIQSTGFEVSVEMPLKAYFLGYKITEVPTVWMDRKEGKSKFHVFKEGPGYIGLYIWAIWKKIRG